MRTIASIVLLGFFILLADRSSYPQSENWLSKLNRIQLLADTYDDVVEFLGEPEKKIGEPRSYGEDFQIDEGSVFVVFASGKCVRSPDTGKLVGWRVPEWTAILIMFFPDKPFTPESAGFRESDFRKSPVDNFPVAFEWENEDKGIILFVRSDGTVKSLQLSPPKSQYHRHCR